MISAIAAKEREIARRAPASPIKPLLSVLSAAAQDRQPEHQQNVANNRARDRRFDHAGETFRERNHGDNQFRRVAKRGIQYLAAPSPIRTANASVARPIHPASGTMPMAEQMKRAVGFSATGQNRNTIAIGTNRRSQLSDGFNFTMNTGGIADTNPCTSLERAVS